MIPVLPAVYRLSRKSILNFQRYDDRKPDRNIRFDIFPRGIYITQDLFRISIFHFFMTIVMLLQVEYFVQRWTVRESDGISSLIQYPPKIRFSIQVDILHLNLTRKYSGYEYIPREGSNEERLLYRDVEKANLSASLLRCSWVSWVFLYIRAWMYRWDVVCGFQRLLLL